MENKIKKIDLDYSKKIKQATHLRDLDKLYLELFGKNGQITQLPRDFSNLSRDQLKIIGTLFNQIKNKLEKEIEQKRTGVREKGYKKLSKDKIDLNSKFKIKQRQGYIHPLSQFQKKIEDLFGKIGFMRFDAPHIDTDFYNFEVLNIPQNHPARDLWDTLFIDNTKGPNNSKVLLKTHTSNAQVRIMERYKPPFRMIVIDRCFRYENLDARHEHTFDQFELIYVDKGLSMANLQYLSEYYFKSILGADTVVRMRPKYYPFVEPTAGIDAMCIFCKGKGCKICGEGWIELAGAGMIHPQVLRNGGLDPEIYSGIAWGGGLERFLMLLYGVEDVRLFRSGDLKFLENFDKGDRE